MKGEMEGMGVGSCASARWWMACGDSLICGRAGPARSLLMLSFLGLLPVFLLHITLQEALPATHRGGSAHT